MILAAAAFLVVPFSRGRCDASVLEVRERRLTAAEVLERGGEPRKGGGIFGDDYGAYSRDPYGRK